jgi:hypothetical protein
MALGQIWGSFLMVVMHSFHLLVVAFSLYQKYMVRGVLLVRILKTYYILCIMYDAMKGHI